MTPSNSAIHTLNGTPYCSVSELLLSTGKVLQEFKIDPQKESTIKGKQGTILEIPAYSFTDFYGQKIKETVTIQLKEVFSQSEILLSGLVSAGEEQIFDSSGQIFIHAYCGSTPLMLLNAIKVKLPVKRKLNNLLSMKLFVGSKLATRSFESEKMFGWRLASKKPLKVKRGLNGKYIYFEVNQFNWYNCNGTQKRKRSRSMLTVKWVGTQTHFDDVSAFVIMNESNAVKKMYKGRDRFSLFNLPSNQAASILLIGIHNGRIFMGIHEDAALSNRKIFLSVREVSRNELFNTITAIGS